MNNSGKLFDYEDNITTSMGAWFAGERVVYRGKDLFTELADEPWMRLLLYGITGKIFNDNQIKLFESIWVISTSFPDPRLWNNRIAALAGTARSSGGLGITAAIAASEATIYGMRPIVAVSDFLIGTKRALDNGEKLEEIIDRTRKVNRIIPGYGRPIIDIDERIAPLKDIARNLELADGDHFRLAFEIEAILNKKNSRINMNVAAAFAGLTADQGLSSREHYYFMTLCFTAGMFPCMIDTFENPEGAFLPLRCNRIAYEGVKERAWN